MSLFIKFLRIIVAVVLIIFVWFYVVPYRILIGGPFSCKEMDLNKDGFISPDEADYFASHGTREYIENNIKCKEYFAYKDGRTLKKECGTK